MNDKSLLHIYTCLLNSKCVMSTIKPRTRLTSSCTGNMLVSCRDIKRDEGNIFYCVITDHCII